MGNFLSANRKPQSVSRKSFQNNSIKNPENTSNKIVMAAKKSMERKEMPLTQNLINNLSDEDDL